MTFYYFCKRVSLHSKDYFEFFPSTVLLVFSWFVQSSFVALSIFPNFGLFSRSFEAAIDSLKYIQKLTETKRFSLVKDLQALIKETKAMMTGDDDEESSVEVQWSWLIHRQVKCLSKTSQGFIQFLIKLRYYQGLFFRSGWSSYSPGSPLSRFASINIRWVKLPGAQERPGEGQIHCYKRRYVWNISK